MTRPSALVLDGNQVKLRLQAERAESGTPVHVDWVRFTVLRRHSPDRPTDAVFGLSDDYGFQERWKEFAARLAQVPDCDHAASAEALDLATDVVACLGPDYTVATEPRKGHDFYRFRISIERAGVEVGWVGYQASSDSPRQHAQAKTLHANLYGAACTFAEPGWNLRLADLVEQRAGTVTRVDLALDFFDGYPGGIQRVSDDYDADVMLCLGQRPKCNKVGDWSAHSKGARSIYIGSKEAGKQTNCYEKGDQLFGVEAGSPWLRFELRYGNKFRELPVDMLRRPADFFAGASDWHASVLKEADAIAQAQKVPQVARLPLQTVEAEVTRVVRWVKDTAGAALAFCWRELPDEAFLTLVGDTRLPGRLARLAATPGQVAQAITSVIKPVEGFGRVFA